MEDIYDATLSDTTRVEVERLRTQSAAHGSEQDETRKILLTLYQGEKQKLKELEHELGQTNSQALRFASDLTKVYREVKDSKRELAEANSQLRKYAVDLRKTISSLRQTNEELEESYYDTIRRLVIAAEFKDRDTGNHITRISRYSALMAEKIGMTPDEVHTILYASPMHDIGKIGIPDRILLKTEKLLDAEFDLMKLHTLIGSNILANSKARVLQRAQEIALYHHEKWNGTGYPQGVSRYEIPLHARVVSLVDTFDALTSKRPYKAPCSIDVSCDIIRSERERHFDPELVDVFFGHLDDILRIRTESSDDSKQAGASPLLALRNPEMERLAQLYR